MVVYGKEVSALIKKKLKDEVSDFYKKTKRKPCLAVIIVGEDPASQTYVKNKIIGCRDVGMESQSYEFKDGTNQSIIEDCIRELALDNNVDGILVQLPLPEGYDERKILSLIPDEKDVDGFSPKNLGLLAINNPHTISCTPLGIMKILEYIGVSLKGKNAVVIGRSNTVGKPMAMLLLNADCTVTICHSKTKNIAQICSNADIIVAAVGIPRFVTADFIKNGAIVIDVGINRVDGKLVGDVDFDEVSKKSSFITPVPGGVGPMTISMLLYNTLQIAKTSLKL